MSDNQKTETRHTLPRPKLIMSPSVLREWKAKGWIDEKGVVRMDRIRAKD